ncbi:MAG TPA: sulfatase-like hydrolase/transferase [Candidatus Fusicatenibacter intestinigallinarum]|uniref:Sulfatase-like hydrolase/transferase n=1 Tax=Candidatus Fusicatenibacter intestinigallinarum TaxID=2838598 RepID=A0A9D2NBH6_9FIRM|nr:sulfatase-like hydrolase/transferase [Candidatus Fusicatenibacter intestinigallinarum]
MVRLYEKLKTGGKARAACAGWILYWGIALGLLLFERELIVGTTEKDRKLYLPVFAGMIVLCFAAWGVSLARFARASEKRKKPVLLNAKLLLPVLLNAGYLFFEIEYIGNTEFFEMKWYYMLLNVGVIFLFCLFLTGIFNSLKRAMIFLNIFYYVMSLVFYYVYHFRGEAFQLIDLYSIGTAAEVVGGYTFDITRQMVLMLVATMIVVNLWKQSRNYVLIRRGVLPRILLRGVTALAIGGFYLLYMYLNWNAQFGVISDLWNPAKTYRQYGTTVGFMAVAKYMRLTPPEGYSAAEVERIIGDFESGQEEEASSDAGEEDQKEDAGAEAKASGTVTPVNIIAIMNESWFDYRTIGDPQTSEDYMPFLDSLTDNIIKGHTLTCTKGGGTAKTEYEFLTGNSCKRFPGMVPYVSYFTHSQYSIVTTLSDQGYRTVAMHPNKATNWKRTTAYRFLDFDEFIAIDQFPSDAERYRNMISDQANYEEIVRVYEEKEKGEPLFLFDITMQNHSGYTNKYFQADVNCEGYDSDEADQYFSLLKLSDQAIEYLITYFEQVDEPTMIVMFGDHSPKLPDEFETWIAGNSYDSLSIRDQEKFYGTPFFIWTNYKMESQENVWTSTNYLSSYMLSLTGLELTPYNEYLLNLREKIPALNHLGYLDPYGIWHRWENGDSETLELEREYECLQYNELMDSQNRVDEFFQIKQTE